MTLIEAIRASMPSGERTEHLPIRRTSWLDSMSIRWSPAHDAWKLWTIGNGKFLGDENVSVRECLTPESIVCDDWCVVTYDTNQTNVDRRLKSKRRVNKTPAPALAWARAWRAANLERVAATAKRYRTRLGPEKRRLYHLRNRYGMELDAFGRLLAIQCNRCAICGKVFGDVFKDTCVDHCHRTGDVRGLLCRRCNRALGLLVDDVAILLRAIDYLQRAKRRAIEGIKAWDVERDSATDQQQAETPDSTGDGRADSGATERLP